MARRTTNRRRRRRRSGFFYKLLTVLVICAAIVAALTMFFKVNTIQITGGSRYTQQEILDASGVKDGDNLILLNKYEIANRLIQKLPYIEGVQINRSLPSTLRIQVTECSSVFAVTQDGTVWMVSSGGKIVESCTPEQAKGTPTIDGCELLAPSVGSRIALSTDRQSQQTSLLALLKALEDASLIQQVNAIHLDSTAELTMDYADRFQVVFLYGADYAYKLRNLTAVIGALESNQTGTIDLTRNGEAHFLPD